MDRLALEEMEVRLLSNSIVPVKCECEQLHSLGFPTYQDLSCAYFLYALNISIGHGLYLAFVVDSVVEYLEYI